MTTKAAPPPPSAPPPTTRPRPSKPSSPVVEAAIRGFAAPEKTNRGYAIVVNAVEGWGKTSLIANAPGSAILMSSGETGYLTLWERGLAPKRPQLVAETWKELLGEVDALIASPGDVKVLGLDALGGFERLCHEHICETEFGGDWGEKGFAGWQRGPSIAVTEWLGFLERLERLRNTTAVHVVLLAHARIAPFKNPTGADFDRYVCDCNTKTWSVTHKWADAVLFGKFYTVVETDKPTARKGKGVGGTERVLYTTHSDAWDAKNRFGLPEEFTIPNDRTASWSVLDKLIFNGAPNA